MKTGLVSGICLSVAIATSMVANPSKLPEWGLRLGWALVHSTWQLAAIALLAALGSVAMSRRSANQRYLVLSLALAAMFVAPAVTWCVVTVPKAKVVAAVAVQEPVAGAMVPAPPEVAEVIRTYSSETGTVPDPEQPILVQELPVERSPQAEVVVVRPFLIPTAPAIDVAGQTELAPRPKLSERIRGIIVPWLGFIDAFWLVGVIMLSIRPVWGLWTQYRLRRVGLSPVSDELKQQLERLANRMGIACAVRIAVSTLVRVPMVVGYLRPMILLPASVLTGLTPGQLESLLAHELAHIRRHDWAVNALQIIVETLLFYHPAVWWLSKRIRHERELCCDDLALALVQDKLNYGRMLLALEELLHGAPTPSLAATGGNLVQRIRRLLPDAKPAQRSFNGWLAGYVGLLVIAVTGSLSILSAQPPAKTNDTPLAANPEKPNEATPSPEPVAMVVEISSHDAEFRDPVIDLRTMTTNDSHWYTDSSVTMLYENRWLRSRGYGDLTRTEEGNWIGFRGTTLVVIDQEDLDQAARLPIGQLKALFQTEGRVEVPEADFGMTRCLAIQTGEGDLYVGKLIRPFPWSLKLDLRRLTKENELLSERPDQGVESAAWGPVVDGLQAGIVYRARDPQEKMEVMIGDMISVKLFMRNASQEVKTYEWQLEDEFPYLKDEDRAERTPPTLPIFHSWQPILRSASGQRAVISPPPDHQKYVLQKAMLEPGEAVLIGTATTSLWSAVDVDFGTCGDRMNAAEVAPGEYRLLTEIDARLGGSEKLKTGELSLQVMVFDPVKGKILAALDAIPHKRKNNYEEKYWSPGSEETNGNPPGPPGNEFEVAPDDLPGAVPILTPNENPQTRPLLNRPPVEYLILPGLVTDEERRRPLEGIVVKIDVAAQTNHSVRDLCEYQAVTDADGRYDIRIPRPLLAGYLNGNKGEVRLFTSHPTYGTTFQAVSMDQLRTMKLIDKKGDILKQGERPEADKAAAKKAVKLADVQVIKVRSARTISGRLVGPSLQPLPNVPIYGREMTSIGFPSALILENTDAAGRFRFNVPAKTTVHLEFRLGDLPSKEIKVTPDQTDLGDLVAGEGARIRGQVLDAKGKPVGFVTMTAPPVPREGVGVMTFKADAQGRFESHLLQPGEYQLEVGEVRRPEDEQQNMIRISGPPPDLYLPYRFKIEAGVKLPDVTLSPATSTEIRATLVSTAKTGDENDIGAFDVVFLKHLLQQPVKISVNGQPQEEVKAPELTIKVDANSGKISVKGDPDNQWVMGMSFMDLNAEVPSFAVHGILGGRPWSAQTNIPSLFVEADDSENSDKSEPKPEALPSELSVKVPRDVKGLVLDSTYPLQHVQIGNGPKLFGTSFQLPDQRTGPLEVKIYRYKATTLRVHLTDAQGKQIKMENEKLPDGITTAVRFSRDEAMRRAGATITYADPKTEVIYDHELYYFTIPGEEMDLTLNINGRQVQRKFTLKDGETRTAELKIGDTFEWTETSKPTPKVQAEVEE